MIKLYSEHIIIFDGQNKMARHERSYAKGQWILDINHYLKTFSRKPGAVKNSTALRRVDSRLRELFDKHFVKEARSFIELLVFAQENGHSHQDIMVAYETLLSRGLRKVYVAQIIAILSHVEEGDNLYTITTTGVAQAQQIEENATDTLDSLTHIMNHPNSISYANTQ